MSRGGATLVHLVHVHPLSAKKQTKNSLVDVLAYLKLLIVPGDYGALVRGRSPRAHSWKKLTKSAKIKEFKIFRACGAYRHRRANISILVVNFSKNSYKFRQKP